MKCSVFFDFFITIYLNNSVKVGQIIIWSFIVRINISFIRKSSIWLAIALFDLEIIIYVGHLWVFIYFLMLQNISVIWVVFDIIYIFYNVAWGGVICRTLGFFLGRAFVHLKWLMRFQISLTRIFFDLHSSLLTNYGSLFILSRFFHLAIF